MRLLRGVHDRRGAVRLDGGQKDVDRRAHADGVQINLRADEPFRAALVYAADEVDIRAQRPEALDVQVHRPLADIAAAGEPHLRPAETRRAARRSGNCWRASCVRAPQAPYSCSRTVGPRASSPCPKAPPSRRAIRACVSVRAHPRSSAGSLSCIRRKKAAWRAARPRRGSSRRLRELRPKAACLRALRIFRQPTRALRRRPPADQWEQPAQPAQLLPSHEEEFLRPSEEREPNMHLPSYTLSKSLPEHFGQTIRSLLCVKTSSSNLNPHVVHLKSSIGMNKTRLKTTV